MNTLTDKPKQDNKIMLLVALLSIAVPVIVSLLLFIPQTGKLGDIDVSFLPHLNGVLNSFTSLFLIAGFYFVKQNNTKAHRMMMLSAFGVSALFLISYVLYHFQAPSTKFGDVNADGIADAAEIAAVGSVRLVYFVILLTHIVLAAIIMPFVLLSIYFGITNQVARHKKLSKWTFPMWLYVSITGVVVYLMISPYYPQ